MHPDAPTIRPLRAQADAEACAPHGLLRALGDSGARLRGVAAVPPGPGARGLCGDLRRPAGRVPGPQPQGPFVGYLQTICIVPGLRGQGLGARLVAFAEERIFREHPNVFLCVSSFNVNARRLYERLGYAVVGELTDYLMAGCSEILMRKTRGPLLGAKAIEAESRGLLSVLPEDGLPPDHSGLSGRALPAAASSGG